MLARRFLSSSDCGIVFIASWSRLIASGGVPSGATRPYQEPISMPSRPASLVVGTSGSRSESFLAVRAGGRTAPVTTSATKDGIDRKNVGTGKRDGIRVVHGGHRLNKKNK